MKTLCGRADIDLDKPSESGKTPLLCAIASWWEGVLITLLGRDDIDVKKPSESGEILLLRAVASR